MEPIPPRPTNAGGGHNHGKSEVRSASHVKHDHSHHNHGEATVKPSAAAKYFCPMCPGVESDKPGRLSEMRHGAGAQSGLGRARFGQSDLHLPDAPGSAAGPPRRLPQVRHAAGTDDRDGGDG